MKIHPFAPVLAGALLLAGAAPPASAQSVPDDVRCLLLSNVFGKGGSTDQIKEVAGEALIFYVGRLDGRANDQTVINTMRAQAPTIDPKTAGQDMNACVTRMNQAKLRVQNLGNAAKPPQR